MTPYEQIAELARDITPNQAWLDVEIPEREWTNDDFNEGNHLLTRKAFGESIAYLWTSVFPDETDIGGVNAHVVPTMEELQFLYDASIDASGNPLNISPFLFTTLVHEIIKNNPEDPRWEPLLEYYKSKDLSTSHPNDVEFYENMIGVLEGGNKDWHYIEDAIDKGYIDEEALDDFPIIKDLLDGEDVYNPDPEDDEETEEPADPEAPENPENPEAPENPETPEIPEVPEVPEVPDDGYQNDTISFSLLPRFLGISKDQVDEFFPNRMKEESPQPEHPQFFSNEVEEISLTGGSAEPDFYDMFLG